ncbi:MAG: ATP-binding cassette domain-containing protein [Gammaproteobacteria bacterium]|nr:ATP-binding cassette domain-containing protein [Gammaproteobacteria bacterium]
MSLQLDIAHHLKHFSLTLKCQFPATGISGVFGHSGSGKTTLLRCIAGLDSHVSGTINFHGQSWLSKTKNMLTEQRNIGVIFQDSRLFPHLTVLQNLTLAQQQAKKPQLTIKKLSEDFIIDDLLEKPANQLSAGQQQRVAIVRSLLAQPQLLLLDEPLSALHHSAKETLMSHLKKLSDQLNLPMIYVSHSPNELAFMCDNLLLLDNGKMVAFGQASTLLAQQGLLGQQGVISHIDLANNSVTIELSPQQCSNLQLQQNIILKNNNH